MTNFELTLNKIQSILNDRLLPGYNRIWVQGVNKPSGVQLVFTIFGDKITRVSSNYEMKFTTIKNFRQFRPDGNPTEEMEIINRHVESFRTLLSEYISY